MSHNDDLMIPRYVNMTVNEYGYLLSQSSSQYIANCDNAKPLTGDVELRECIAVSVSVLPETDVAAEIVALKNEVVRLKEQLKTIKVCICAPG